MLNFQLKDIDKKIRIRNILYSLSGIFISVLTYTLEVFQGESLWVVMALSQNINTLMGLTQMVVCVIIAQYGMTWKKYCLQFN